MDNKWPKIVFLADDGRVPIIKQRKAAVEWVGKSPNSNWYGDGNPNGGVDELIDNSRKGDVVGVFNAALLVPPKAQRKRGGQAGETFYRITDDLLRRGVQIYEISTGRCGANPADLNAMIQEGRTFLAGRRPRRSRPGRPTSHVYSNDMVLKIGNLW
jgi:hypothetical protein